MAAPFVPLSDDIVLERVVPGNDPAEAEARALTVRLRAEPGNRALAVRLARLEIGRGQTLADPRYFGRAEAALSPFLTEADPPPDVRVPRAIVRQFYHDFAAAEADLGAVLAAEPANAQARLTRAAIRQVRADYAGAATDCAQLIGVAPPAALDICVAGVAAMTGHARLAIVKLTMIAAAPDTTPPLRVWALTVKGEAAARLGDTETAAAAFQDAHVQAPDDVYLLAAWADALMDAGRPDAAGALLADRTRADGLLLRLAEAEQQQGRPDPDRIAQLTARFETARRRGETVHRREEARFLLHLLHDPAGALVLARSNWLVQREPADAAVLLEAAIAAESPEDAAPVLAWRLENHIEDARLDRLAASPRLAAR